MGLLDGGKWQLTADEGILLPLFSFFALLPFIISKMLINPKMLKPMRRMLFPALLCAALFSACKKSNESGGGPDGNNGAIVELNGTVVDENGVPVAGAAIKSDALQTTTNATGNFKLGGVKPVGSALVVYCSKNGYHSQTRHFTATGGNSAGVRITLQNRTTTHTLNAAAGGTLTLPRGASVQIPAGALVKPDGSTYNGAVDLAITHLDPADPQFSVKIPGGDLAAERTDKSAVVLYSYGMIDVDMTTTAGEKLQLKSGKTSLLSFPIPAFQQATAPATIPLWHFDEASGVWKEDGIATRQGDRYVGTVGHFSTWNVDDPKKSAMVEGFVADPCQSGSPKVPGANVTIGQITVQTDKDGKFKARVPAGMAITMKLDPKLNNGRGATKEIAPMAAGGSVTQHISFPCGPQLTGRITNCEGKPWVGFVSMYLNGELLGSAYTDDQSRFLIFGPKGKTIVLKAFDMVGGSSEQTIAIPADDSGKELGDVKVCAKDQLKPAQFKINGGGYNQQTVQIGGKAGETFVALGMYDVHSHEILCTMVAGNQQLSLRVEAEAAGTFEESVLTMQLNGKTYTSQTMQVKITKFGQEGELVQGTFSGQAKEVNGTAVVSISEGKFEVLRIKG